MGVRTSNLWLHYFQKAPSLWVRTAAACLDNNLAAACLAAACQKQWADARVAAGAARTTAKRR
ncbi:MAG: hypothetical protein E6K49_02415 [Gammaproteobacteria bacterium]|nr:MAG: hypothetical protein E6K49_02415 [Gammaproteobacteria bacterium]